MLNINFKARGTLAGDRSGHWLWHPKQLRTFAITGGRGKRTINRAHAPLAGPRPWGNNADVFRFAQSGRDV